MLARFPEMLANEFSEVKGLKMNVRIVTFGGRKYILKKHITSYEDLIFRQELEAYVLHDLSSPHIVEFVGYTVDAEEKVDAMILKFSMNYDIRLYIRRYRPDDWNLKRKWIAQITHGLMTIHQFGNNPRGFAMRKRRSRRKFRCSNHRCGARPRDNGRLVSLEISRARVGLRTKLGYVLSRSEYLGTFDEWWNASGISRTSI